MQADRLRLAGFKSFADVAEVTIGPGLTGIVGPNGCGKSNLGEALRWVMGETSAKRLRGGAMDDVIFGGAAGRPARNIAEVALTIDNSARDAPFAFNDRAEIEIIRHIERGGGSVWRINGREVRARDVQLLFADAATGGPSGAIVSQGRVGALIEAKPAERRFLLEDAAGTAGLQARRRETELKLAAAADNLARLDDVTATMTAQLRVLKRQAGHAQRYRRLGDEIRRHEALLFYARWRAAEAAAGSRAAELDAAERDVTEAAANAAGQGLARAEAEAALPELRRDEAAAAAELQHLAQARAALEAELARVVAARSEAERRLAELARDRAREEALVAEAEAALARLAAERGTLAVAAAGAPSAGAPVMLRLTDAAARLAEAEAELQRATEAAAVAAARRAALDRRRRELADRRTRLEGQLADAGRQRASLLTSAVSEAAVTAAGAALAEAEAETDSRRAALENARRELEAGRQREGSAHDVQRRAASRLARIEAEAEALDKLLKFAPQAPSGPAGVASAASGAPLLSALHVAAGFEAAIGALFEDELFAPLGDGAAADAACFWADLGAIGSVPAPPPGAHPLAEAVTAPAVLDRRLALAGWVDSEAEGRSLQRHLAPGQRLVDRDGRLWRWDGFTRYAAGPSAAARHLEHQNRREVLAAEIAEAAAAAQSATAEADAATKAHREAADAERRARAGLSEAEAALARAQKAEAEIARRALVSQAQLTGTAARLDQIAAELAETQAQAEETEGTVAAAGELGALPAQALEAARAASAQARRNEAEARAEVERLARAAQLQAERLASLDLEERSWRKRAAGAMAQRATLVERQHALDREMEALDLRPAAIAAETEALGCKISDVAQHGRQSAERLARGETRLREAVESCRLADQTLAEARERRARVEVQNDGATEALSALARTIRERLDMAPAALAGLAGLAGGAAPAEPSTIEARLLKLQQERDSMGPVNLVAESDADALGSQVAALERERAELTEAIGRLRRGAAALDDEGRQLLAAAFAQVNAHFAALFTRLFGGGKAELTLTEDGDPLGAGLEIMASPAGKRLQSLTLLSGGEQALTALALLFAVFLTKPAPICVLDEVDAPLDDANVDRLCRLVAEIADTTGTRFLLITHHRITMARADRLFGVTMAERGVSQLVSVDLARAARLRQTA
ncbi:MAG TPA: chromosome segregation protein SMC [Stellaceae bacterium]|jgi:chromosome segregation protein